MQAPGWGRSSCGILSARACWCTWWMCRMEAGANLEDKPMLMVASRIDVANKDKVAKLKRYCKKEKMKLYEISAVTGKGIESLKFAIAEEVEALRAKDREASEQEASRGVAL